MSDAHFSAYGCGRGFKEGWEDSIFKLDYRDWRARKVKEIIEQDAEFGQRIKHALVLAQKGVDPFASVSPSYRRDELKYKIARKYPWLWDYLSLQRRESSM